MDTLQKLVEPIYQKKHIKAYENVIHPEHLDHDFAEWKQLYLLVHTLRQEQENALAMNVNKYGT